MADPEAGGVELGELARRFTDSFNTDDLNVVMSYFADDAIYVTFDGRVNRGRRAIREAFEPQFRGDFGILRFHTEDIIAHPTSGKAVVRWLCRHELTEAPGLPAIARLKRAAYRGLYGRVFGWHGLDVLRFEGGLVREKYTYSRTRLPLAERDPPTPKWP
jgi:ketosteroid isomerase-like protein